MISWLPRSSPSGLAGHCCCGGPGGPPRRMGPAGPQGGCRVGCGGRGRHGPSIGSVVYHCLGFVLALSVLGSDK